MNLGMQVGLGPGHVVLDGTQLPFPKRGRSPPIFDPYLLWINGWMDQDNTWQRARPQPRQDFVRWGPSSSPPKGSRSPIFGPCLLWPDGCMDQDEPWHGGRSRPRPHCARWGQLPLPKRGRSPQFSAHICCGQMAGWIKMPLGTEVGFSPSDSPSSPSPKGRGVTQFSAHVFCCQTAGWIKMALGTEVGLGPATLC